MRNYIFRLWNYIASFFNRIDKHGVEARRLDSRDNGSRWKKILFRRIVIATVLLTLPQFFIPSSKHADVPATKTETHKVSAISYSEFIKQARDHKFEKALIVSDGAWQLVIATEKGGSQRIQSLFPQNIDVTSELQSDGVDMSFTTPDTFKPKGFWHNSAVQRFLGTLVIMVVELAAMFGIFYLFSRRIGQVKFKPVKRRKDLSLDDVAGISDIRIELDEIISYASQNDTYLANNAEIPRGWLFTGPPGNGKTLTAEAVAAVSNVPFFKTSGSEFVEMYVGLGAKRIRSLKKAALKAAKKSGTHVIVFLDEVDVLAAKRGGQNSHVEHDQTLNELLVSANGSSDNDPIIWIAATNRPDILDPAFSRRFNRQIAFSLPDIKQREELLNIVLRKKGIDTLTDDQVSVIASSTTGMSGDALTKLVNSACLEASRDGRVGVDAQDFFVALDKTIMGIPRHLRLGMMSHAEKERTARHEAGHAIVATVLERCNPVYKATIVPHGMSFGEALGMVVTRPERDKYTSSINDLKAELAKTMGGLAAESIFYENDVSSGVSGDLQNATNLAYSMVAYYGMGKQGRISLNSISNPSQSLLRNIEDEVSDLIDEATKHAINILRRNQNALERVSAMLIAQETLDGDVIQNVVKQFQVNDNRLIEHESGEEEEA